MEEYKINIFLTKDKACAFDWKSGEISIEGNIVWFYEGNKEKIDIFLEALKNHYSMGNFSQSEKVSFSFTIICCGCDFRNAFNMTSYLAEMEAENVNLIDVDKIIPLLLEQKGLADKNRVVSVTISGMNMVYDVTISEEGAYTIVENQSSYDVQELSLSDFNILYDRHMDISRKEMDALKSANKNLKNEIEGLKKFRDDYEQKKRDIERDIESESNKLLEDYKRKPEKAERKKSLLSSEERRCVCYSVTNRGNRSGDVGELLIVPKVKDRELVKKGQNLFEIISVTRTRTGGRGPKFKKSPENKKRILKSERDGKVFFDDELQSKNWRTCYVDTEETWCYSLKEKRQNYTLCYHYKSNQIKGFRVCVVGNTDDTPDEIHDWLVEKGKKESGDSLGKADLTKVSKKSSEKKSANGSAEVLKDTVNIKEFIIKEFINKEFINKIFKKFLMN
ncbi:hypothetical protein [Dialister invisus]|uniref:hypothetical protein n=1 Tax=Dialister invisus TaxID=218538 RepID=UPI003AADC02C